MLKNLIFLICLVFLSSSVLAQENSKATDYKFIVPLQTTRAEIEKVFGEPANSDKFQVLYKSKNFNLLVTYSYGKCTDEKNSGWNVRPDTVTHFTIHFGTREVLLSSLNLDRSKFRKVETHHGYYLGNDEDGMLLFTSEEEILVGSIYYSPKKADYKLLCNKK